MASLDQLKQTFFDECDEALQQIEAGLSDIRDGHNTDDTVNAVFRAVHSVKGGAGVFGFERLVGFAHVFETVLDAVRRGDLAPQIGVLDVLLAASDVLSDLVSSSRSGTDIPEGFGSDCRASLEALIAANGAGGGDEPAPADFEGLDFTPVRFDQMDEPASAQDLSGPITYQITIRPRVTAFINGETPATLLARLRGLGALTVVADIASLPPITALDANVCHLTWSAKLSTTASRAEIEAIFAPVGDSCAVEIDGPPMPVAEAAAPMAMEIALPAEVPPPPAPAIAEEKPATKPPVAEAPEPNGKARAAAKSGATTTRIELTKIDRVVNMVGELVIAQAMLSQIVQDLPEGVSGRLSQNLEEVIHHTRELKDSVMSMRAQPVGMVFERMPRLVRELAAKTGKKVRLDISGETTEVDRSIIERLADPLTHIIRNSADHGIESPADRVAAGKNEEGVIRLSAEHRGGRIVIEVRDDGAGINSDRVFKKAVEKGLVSPDASLSEDEVNNLIMLPGFSTAEKVSDISGRGVGMDVVRSNIQEIGGRISLKSERGRGMTIQFALPLTLAVMDGMVIKSGGETYVIPLSAILECLRPSQADINNLIGTRGMLQLRGDLVPLVLLSDLLDVAPDTAADRVVIVTDAGDGRRYGLVVDELCGHQQVVIKSIEESYGSIPGIAAATILGNGRVAFVLDVEKLSDLAISPSSRVAMKAA